ncbi:4986_t:CDS:2, partial [Paraglomus brasilianum]
MRVPLFIMTKSRVTRRAQEFFFHSFQPPQAKLHIWPSLIHDHCASQARHTHTYSDAKNALKNGVRNVKENIKEGVKTDLSAWKTVKWISTGICLVLFDLSFASWYNHRNERILLHAFEHGSCPEPDVKQKQLIDREVVIKKLRQILKPISDDTYHVIVGNHGTGKTTVVRQCARDVGKGVIYVDVPPVLDNFVNNLADAIGFKEHVSITESLKRKILGNSES